MAPDAKPHGSGTVSLEHGRCPRQVGERGSDAVAEDAEVPAVAFAATVTAQAWAHGGLEEAQALEWVVGVGLARSGILAGSFTFAAKKLTVHGLTKSEIKGHACYSSVIIHTDFVHQTETLYLQGCLLCANIRRCWISVDPKPNIQGIQVRF